MTNDKKGPLLNESDEAIWASSSIYVRYRKSNSKGFVRLLYSFVMRNGFGMMKYTK